MATILGLDIGTNSLGWALVEVPGQLENTLGTSGAAAARLWGLGSHVFPEGVLIDAKSKAESPRGVERRLKRQTRRQLFRRKFRNLLLTRALQRAGLLPTEAAGLADFWATPVGEGAARDPYVLRARALDAPLSAHELGRVLYHLNQRRGFRSNRLARTDDEEGGALVDGLPGKPGFQQAETEWAAGGHRTFGEYLNSLDPRQQRRRNRYTRREWYEQELAAIWAAQQPHHPDVLTDTLREYLINPATGVVLYQRPLRSQKHRLGKCPLEPAKPRAPKSALEFEEFRMCAVLNNLEISGPERDATKLAPAERALVQGLFEKGLKTAGKQGFALPRSAGKVTGKQMLAALKLPEGLWKLNYEAKEEFPTRHVWQSLRAIFGEARWEAISAVDFSLAPHGVKAGPQKPLTREDIWHVLASADNADWLLHHAQAVWGLPPDHAAALTRLHLPTGYASLSRKALRKILPWMNGTATLPDGSAAFLTYDKAAAAAGYHHSQLAAYAKTDVLAAPKVKANPIVQQALIELRRLVNQVLHEYGAYPEIIRVEMARELKQSARQREETRRDQLRNRDRNERIRAHLLGLGVARPTFADIEKYRLWDECRGVCLYTGETIAEADLFFSGRYEIEHILPYSRTLDDGFANKTVSAVAANRDKGNRTPYEWLSADPRRYQQLLERARTCLGSYQSRTKLRRFEQTEINDGTADGFVQRQLNDTRYIAREAKAYLESLPNVCVQVAMGTTTAPLRHHWGLNHLLNPDGTHHKNRDDHRHHAIDAAVIACTTPRMLHVLATHAQRRLVLGRDHHLPLPWPNFQAAVADALDGLLVSHKGNRRAAITSWNRYARDTTGAVVKGPDGQPLRQRSVSPRGPLHKETGYGRRTNPETGALDFVTRKPLASLTAAMVAKIADRAIRELVRARLRAFGADPDARKFDIPKEAFAEPLYLPNRHGAPVPIRTVRIASESSGAVLLKEGQNLWVEPGSNHHAAVYQDLATGAYLERIVTFFEAVERRRQGIPVVTPPAPGERLLTTLRLNELFLLGLDPATIDWHAPDLNHRLRPYLYRVQQLSKMYWVFRHHQAATIADDAEMQRVVSFKRWQQLTPLKVLITVTGQLRPAPFG